MSLSSLDGNLFLYQKICLKKKKKNLLKNFSFRSIRFGLNESHVNIKSFLFKFYLNSSNK